MRTLLPLIRKELIVLRRDWHALLLLFAMPTLFILLMSLALRDKFAEGAGAPFTFYLVNQDSADALSDTLVAVIRTQRAFRHAGRSLAASAPMADRTSSGISRATKRRIGLDSSSEFRSFVAAILSVAIL